MRTQWYSSTQLTPAAREALASLDQCFSLQGSIVSRDHKSSVIRYPLDGQALYVKRYTKTGKVLRRYLGRSRVKAEWENLLLFQQWGIATPPLLAYGQKYCRGHFERGAIVTEEVRGAKSLFQLASEQHPALSDCSLVRQIATRIADYTRCLHNHGFAHNDLDWRNILIVLPTKQAPLQVLFFDCPGGRFWIGPFLEHRIVKDLAHLDKLARQHLSLRSRLRFYRQYTGKKQLDAKDRQRLEKINGFFDASRYRSILRW